MPEIGSEEEAVALVEVIRDALDLEFQLAFGFPQFYSARDARLQVPGVSVKLLDNVGSRGNTAVYRNFRNPSYQGFSPKRMQVGGPLGVPDFGCYEVLQRALKAYPIAPEDIPEPFNLFQTLEFKEDKSFSIVDGRSKPGDYIEFLADMDTLCGLSTCPSMGRPLRVQVFTEE